MSKTVSISEILAWRSCRRKWYYAYDRRLEPLDRSPFLASGTVVHGAIGAVLSGVESRDDILDIAQTILETELVDEGKVAKYLPGVVRALGKVPSWLWEKEWTVEQLLEQDYDGVTVRGKPDMYAVGDVIDIVEVKTGQDPDPL